MNKWECPLCWTWNRMDVMKCVYCDTPAPLEG